MVFQSQEKKGYQEKTREKRRMCVIDVSNERQPHRKDLLMRSHFVPVFFRDDNHREWGEGGLSYISTHSDGCRLSITWGIYKTG